MRSPLQPRKARVADARRASVWGLLFCALALAMPLLLTACDKPYFDRDRGVFVFHRPGK